MSGTPTMAEVLADELVDVMFRRYGITSGTSEYEEMGKRLALALQEYGYGSKRDAAVEALTQAAEALDDLKLNPANDEAPYLIREYNDGLTSAAEEVRDRATKIGEIP